MDFRATKTRSEREQEEDERLIRPSPKVKPPRRDLRREHVRPDPDPDSGDSSDAKDRSRDRKTMAAQLAERFKGARRSRDRVPAKNRETGDTVMISPDTLKEQPGKYQPVDSKEPAKEPPKNEGDFYYPDFPGAKSPPKEEPKPEPPRNEGDFYYGPPRGGFLPKKEPEPEPEQDEDEEEPELEEPEEPEDDEEDDEEEDDGPEEETFQDPAYESDQEPSEEDWKEPPAEEPSSEEEQPEAQPEEPSKEDWKAPEEGSPEQAPVEGEPQEEPTEAPQEAPAEAPAEAAPEAKKPKEKKPKKPKKEPQEAPGEPKPEPTALEKAGIPAPQRRPTNSAEREEALSLLVDTFPPDVSSELIAKNMHPDDVRSLVQSYTAARKVDPKRMGDVIAKASSFFETDPDRVQPPTTGKNAKGETVSFDDLTPEEQAEAARQYQLKVAAMSLAAKSMLTKQYEGRGMLTGKPRIPKQLASTLAHLVLGGAPEEKSGEIAAQVFDAVIEGGQSANISDKSARMLLQQVGMHPAAKAAATAYLQANDYAQAKQRFLRGDDESLSEWQSPKDILKGLRKASQYFDARNSLYGIEGSAHPAASYFRSRVMTRLRALDPKKARMIAAALPVLEEQEYKDRHRKWEAKYQAWAAKDVAHDKAVEQYMDNPKGEPPGAFTDPEPVEPHPPTSMVQPDQENIWDSLSEGPAGKPKAPKEAENLEPEEKAAVDEAAAKATENPPKLNDGEVPVDEEERKAIAQAAEERVNNPPQLHDKQASDFTYPAVPVMGKTAIYHGVDPYAYGPAAYPGWLQPHQRDIGEADFKVILGMAEDWLKSPLLSVAVEGMIPDARYRAALDLAIYDSPYNRAINPTQYNSLLAKLAGEKPGQPLLTIQKEAASYKTEARYFVVHGSTALGRDVLAAIESAPFPFTDESGKSHKTGHVAVKVRRTVNASETPLQGQVPETVVRVDFPQGSERVALQSVRASLAKFRLMAEPTTPGYQPQFRASSFSPPPSDSAGGSTPMKASQEIRKFASEVAKTNSKLAFDMLATADRLAEEEKQMPPWLEKKIDDKEDKGQSKEAGIKAGLRALIIKQAASVAASQRGPWIPVLQALKDLG